jgi:murein L,D-transpeptidase YcbB/YkuD
VNARSPLSGRALWPALLLGTALSGPAAAEVPIRGSLVAEPSPLGSEALRPTTVDPEPERSVRPAPPALRAEPVADEGFAAALRLIAADPASIPRPAVVGRGDLEFVLAAYGAQDFRPLWSDASGWTVAGRSLLDRLSRADEDALDPVAYAVPALRDADPALRARADLAASLAAVAYAKHARGGRIEPSRLSKTITPVLDIPAADAVMTALALSPAPGDVLRGFNPPHPGYLALRDKLAEWRGATGSLGAKGGEADPPAKAAAPTEAEIVANMERWRWMPRDLGTRRIEVNVPEYTLRLFDGDRQVHQARVVVGRPKTQTPIFSETMEYVVVNPSWSVPQSILRKEILPKLESDPDYLARHGYQVVRNGDRMSIRQAPGERNALGFIKFMFPNPHAVYIHDTPRRKLFGEAERAFSHGCVRVDKPFDLAEFVLADTGFDRTRLEALIGKGERPIRLARPLPVHIGYFTVVVDETGRLKRFPDIYGHDEKVRTALRQGPSRVAAR